MAGWDASREIAEVVKPYLCEKVRQYGKLQSGVRVYQSIFYPESLRYAPKLTDTIVSSPAYGCNPETFKTDAYCANRLFDQTRKGWITPGDLGAKIKQAVPTPDVKDALQATFALRPGERMQDPAYGGDYIAGWTPNKPRSAQLGDWAAVMTIIASAATTAMILHQTTRAPGHASRARAA
jgi:hypothetical protein